MQSTPTPERYICIHGHFYQPPRENPWLETVEIQDSAAPYHDWNERITAECYAPNGASRILNAENEIIRILNNYSRISFNFGPTLLSWLEDNAPRVYRMILEADRSTQKRFGGHGSAMAQVYNHIIMPLANTRDRITQIRWGIADFERRFGRKPEGMWLAETAVDSETLDLLAEHDILFTILAPYQCARIRPLAPVVSTQAKMWEQEPDWVETPDGAVDTRRPYLVRCRNGRSITIFFYDGPRSRAIAFEKLLNSGEVFADRLMQGFSSEDEPQLVHVTTDGESYGHHHKHGDMALAYALKRIEQQQTARLTNYGEFLEKFPPAFEAEIFENTSWSCFHGIERWRSNCGCNGGHPGWNQQWRAPLRKGLDWLRDTLAPLTALAGKSLFHDVWAARDAYIRVVLDRNTSSIDTFFTEQAARELSGSERTTALKLMELQRHAQLMYTSCGWFFDEISGIETVQIIAYACRVLQLAGELFGADGSQLEEEFIRLLSAAKSNVPEEKDGGAVYRHTAKKEKAGLEQVAAHYAISSIFTSYPQETELFCYLIRRQAYEVVTSGRGRLVLGEALIASDITEETETIAFAVLHFGDQNITAAVERYDPAQSEEHTAFVQAAKAAVVRADFPEVIRLFDRHFGTQSYTIHSLFRDEQRKILELILASTLSEVESNLISIYENHASLLHFLSQAGLPLPPGLALAASFAINAGLRRALESDPIDAIQARTYLALTSADQVALDQHLLSYLADQKMKSAMVKLHAEPEKPERLESAIHTASILTELPFELNLWQAQNIWYDTLKLFRNRPQPPAEWMQQFLALGEQLGISVKDLVVEEENSNGDSTL